MREQIINNQVRPKIEQIKSNNKNKNINKTKHFYSDNEIISINNDLPYYSDINLTDNDYSEDLSQRNKKIRQKIRQKTIKKKQEEENKKKYDKYITRSLKLIMIALSGPFVFVIIIFTSSRIISKCKKKYKSSKIQLVNKIF